MLIAKQKIQVDGVRYEVGDALPERDLSRVAEWIKAGSALRVPESVRETERGVEEGAGTPPEAGAPGVIPPSADDGGEDPPGAKETGENQPDTEGAGGEEGVQFAQGMKTEAADTGEGARGDAESAGNGGQGRKKNPAK